MRKNKKIINGETFGKNKKTKKTVETNTASDTQTNNVSGIQADNTLGVETNTASDVEKNAEADVQTGKKATGAKNDSGEAPAKSFKDKAKAYILSMPKRYFITAFSGMAMGLFCTLIAGTIIKQIGTLVLKINGNFFETTGNALITVGSIASLLMGAGIGAGIARSLKASNLVIFSALVAGMIGAFSLNLMHNDWIKAVGGGTYISTISPGNPIGAYVTSLISVELGRAISGKTKLDIILVPLVVIFSSMLCVFVAYPFIKLVDLIADGIEIATEATPFVMGIVISAAMGLLLTLPTSSAAIWISIASSSSSPVMLLAGGAAVCGCAAHMVGFAVQSYRENRLGGLIAQGLGTSMLQIPNLMRKPKILIPPVIASIIVGPLSTCVFKLRCNASGGGMGTAGLVGVFGTLDASSGAISTPVMWAGIILLMFVIPAAVCILLSELFRKKGFFAYGDMKLDL